MTSLAELEAQLAEYDEQLAGVEELLAEDENNEEYVALKESIQSLMADLKQLIASSATSNAKPASVVPESESVAHEKKEDELEGTTRAEEEHQTTNKGSATTRVGPAQVEEALQRGLYVGLPSEAIWPDDGLWYPATIEAISEAGVRVKFKSYGDVMALDASMVRPASSLSSDKKRKEPSDAPSNSTETPESSQHDLPDNLKFADTDTEKVREWKKRQQKVWKQEKRKERQEVAENKAKVSWQNFNKGLKKTGFGAKKESMFRTAEGYNSKVGVVQTSKTMHRAHTSQPASGQRYTASGLQGQQQSTLAPTYDPLAAPAYYIPGAQTQQQNRPPQRY